MSSFILLMIISAAVCFFAYSIKKKYSSFAQNIEKVDGKLEGYQIMKIKNRDLKVPVASFVTKDGRSVVQKSETSYFTSNAKKGTPVTVCYNTDNPLEMMILGKKFGYMYGVLMICGAIFFLTGFLLLLNYEGIIHLLKHA